MCRALFDFHYSRFSLLIFWSHSTPQTFWLIPLTFFPQWLPKDFGITRIGPFPMSRPLVALKHVPGMQDLEVNPRAMIHLRTDRSLYSWLLPVANSCSSQWTWSYLFHCFATTQLSLRIYWRTGSALHLGTIVPSWRSGRNPVFLFEATTYYSTSYPMGYSNGPFRFGVPLCWSYWWHLSGSQRLDDPAAPERVYRPEWRIRQYSYMQSSPLVPGTPQPFILRLTCHKVRQGVILPWLVSLHRLPLAHGQKKDSPRLIYFLHRGSYTSSSETLSGFCSFYFLCSFSDVWSACPVLPLLVDDLSRHDIYQMVLFEGSLEVKLPAIWTDEKQSREEAERRERLEERRVEEKE